MIFLGIDDALVVDLREILLERLLDDAEFPDGNVGLFELAFLHLPGYDAAGLLMETISRCSTMRDLAVCLYRLAYMEWKLGRNDLSAACYERAIQLKTNITQQAEDELVDLLASDESLKRLSPQETVDILKAAHIPVGDPDEMRMRVARAAIAATDANLHSIAAPLTGTLIDMGRDDVLVDVYHSLKA